MNNAKIKVSHSVVVIISILLWYFAMMWLLDAVGMGDNTPLNESPYPAQILTLGAMVATFLLFILIGNLLSYIVIARVLGVPRQDLEFVIKERAKVDRRERFPLAQKFYAWCLDVAYKQKT